MNIKAQARDQAPHFAAALAILAIFAIGGLVAGALAGAGIGLMRELGEAGTPLTFEKAKVQLTQTDAALDISFWALGGAVAGWLL